MNTIHYEGDWWPTWQQKLLLQAALLQGNKAIDAWHEWKSSVDIDRLDKGSLRLLPLLYRNLRIHGVENPLMSRFKRAHRTIWYENQMLFHNMAILLRSFHNAGIQTMILKGAALTLLYYRDYGLRPMADFDVLVPAEQAQDAILLLIDLGWTPQLSSIDRFTKLHISIINCCLFKNVNGQAVDLHWYVFPPDYCYANIDADFWNASVATTVHDTPTSALNPTDQLLHVCAHGVFWHSVPQIRWAPDAMIIIKTAQSEIDWNRLMTQGRKRRLILPLKDALNFLRDVLDATVPIEILQSLQNMPVSRIERIEYKAKTQAPKLVEPFRTLLLYYLRYSRHVSSIGLPHRLIGFLKALQLIWGVDHLWQVPFYGVFRWIRAILNMKVN